MVPEASDAEDAPVNIIAGKTFATDGAATGSREDSDAILPTGWTSEMLLPTHGSAMLCENKSNPLLT
jgi:hypothetical protein